MRANDVEWAIKLPGIITTFSHDSFELSASRNAFTARMLSIGEPTVVCGRVAFIYTTFGTAKQQRYQKTSSTETIITV